MITLEVHIEPLEPLLFGDNRSARSGESHALADQDPSPVTLFGAVGTRVLSALHVRGRDGWHLAEGVLGPFLESLDLPSPGSARLAGHTLRDAAGKPWFPAPLHLRAERRESGFFGLAPALPAEAEPGVVSSIPNGRRLLALPAEEETGEELFVDEGLLEALLTGSDRFAGQPLASEVRTREQLFQAEPRLGLAIDNAHNTAVEGVLFSRPYRRFAGRVDASTGLWSGAGLVAWMDLPGTGGKAPESFDGIGHLGGDRRRAWFSFAPLAEKPLSRLREQVAAGLPGSRGFLVYLLTPLPADSEAPSFAWGEPTAAAVGRSRPASGWNALGRHPGPRPLRTLIPAGSVFFFQWQGAEASSMEARRAFLDREWLEPADPRFLNAGFGRMLLGVWT